MCGLLKKNIIDLTRVNVSEYREIPKLPVILMADNIRSMQNVGALFRTADAFLIEEVVMCGITGVPPHPEIAKTSLGAEKSVKWRYCADAAAEVMRLKESGWKVYALEQVHGSVPLHGFVPVNSEKYVIVAGNEVEGVQQKIVDIADGAIEIPQHGTKHSLNVAVSGAIAMWHFYSALYASCFAQHK